MIGVELFKVCVTRGGEEFWKCSCGAEWPGWQVGVCPNCGPTLTDAPTEALPTCPCGKVPTVVGQATCAACSLESDILKALRETRNRAAIQTMACISYPRAREVGMSPLCLPVQLCGLTVCADVTIASEDRGVRLSSAVEVADPHAECRAKLDELVSQREQLEVQLAGCSVAALGWSKDQPPLPGDYGWSAAYGDVLNIRGELEAARERVAELESQGFTLHTSGWETYKDERDDALARANRLGDECGRLTAENARLKAGKR